MSCFEWGLWAKLGQTQGFSPTVGDQVHALAKALPTRDQSLAMMNPQVGAEVGAHRSSWKTQGRGEVTRGWVMGQAV